MKSNFFVILFRLFLFPVSLVYGLVVLIRNKLFDWNIKKSVSFDLPIFSVGNITVGGTGKTPHVEYLLEILSDKYKTAVLSRGYKRKTSGFVLASDSSTANEIGDESFQIHSKYPECSVAVCESRVEGISQLLQNKADLEVIILDDAFQHRYVKPGLSILLVDYNRPVFKDFYLPTGNLRDGFYSRKRADIIIVTKANEDVDEHNYSYWKKKLKLLNHQHLYFSNIEYGSLKPVFENINSQPIKTELEKLNSEVLLVTGIAEPKPLISHIRHLGISLETMKFSDHHSFDDADISRIQKKFQKINENDGILLTTEKDAVRFLHYPGFPENLKKHIYYIPISIKILDNKQEELDNKILQYARKN